MSKDKNNGVVLDDTQLAKEALQGALAVVENNEPINLAEGDWAQAALEADTADSIREALAILNAGASGPIEFPMAGAIMDSVNQAVSLSAVEKIQLTKQLAEAFAEVKATNNAVAKIKLGKAIVELRKKLGMDPLRNDGISVTGSELGDFDIDTDEGRKSFRQAVKQYLMDKRGKSIYCKALGVDVDISREGVNKILSFSGDVRKLKVVTAVEQVIVKGELFKTETPRDELEKINGVINYHFIRSELMLGDEQLRMRLVVKERSGGHFQYDYSLHDTAVLDDAKEKAPLGDGADSATNYKSAGRLEPMLPAGSRPIVPIHTESIAQTIACVNNVTLDGVSDNGDSLNIYIEIKDEHGNWIPLSDGAGKLSDRPNDENYRWQDTVKIAGNRKDMMQKTFDDARQQGASMSINDIDWDELQSDARLAEQLITKSNVLGTLDYGALRETAVTDEQKKYLSAVAYYASRFLHALPKQPLVPTFAISQKNYVRMLNTVKTELDAALGRAARKVKPQEMFKEVATAIAGFSSNANSSTLQKQLYEEYVNAVASGAQGQFEQALSAEVVGNNTSLWENFFNNLDGQCAAEIETDAIKFRIKTSRNIVDSINRGKYMDWAWAKLDGAAGVEGGGKRRRTKPRKTTFSLAAATGEIQRVGGRDIASTIKSTADFDQFLGLKGTQSGNWVLKDKQAAEFHIIKTAEAMADMSDILGIEPQYLGLKGHLAMSFGARGKGGALAHYEPLSKVINITKMRGGGSLGHEYFHALDNLLKDLSTGVAGSAGFFCTEAPHDIPDPDLSAAFMKLQSALVKGEASNVTILDVASDNRDFEKLFIQLFQNDTGHLNLDDLDQGEEQKYIDVATNNAARTFYASVKKLCGQYKIEYPDFESSIDVLEFTSKAEALINSAPSWSRNVTDSLLSRAAVAWARTNGLNVSSGRFKLSGKLSKIATKHKLEYSDFYQTALELDMGKANGYWSKPLEMAARAFSAYLQDRLSEQERQNDYLAYSTQGGNGRVGENGYPQGEERVAINQAFDELFKVVREKKILETASSNQALMDSLFSADGFAALMQTTQDPLDDLSVMGEVLTADATQRHEGGALKLYHTSPVEIDKIEQHYGVFGDVLFFSDSVYVTGAGERIVYSIDASGLAFAEPYQLDDAGVVADMAEHLGVGEEDALDLLDGSKQPHDFEPFRTNAKAAEDALWYIQGQQAQCAQKMGYDGCEAMDEQGTVYMIPMFGREALLLKEPD